MGSASEQRRRHHEREPRTEPTTPVADGGPDGTLTKLQRTAGNRAVSALVQAKQEVGAVDDPLEAEADHVAEQVVADIQRRGGSGTSSPDRSAATARGRVAPAGGELDAGSEAAIQQASGGGRPLDLTVRQEMESGLGADFSGVRVHEGPQADGLNRDLGARAFTTGANIFFRDGEYDPATTNGQELLAHELTHVIQQGSATSTAGHAVNRSAAPQAVQRKAYPIGMTTETLEVSAFTSKKHRVELLTEANDILKELKNTYGVAVSSSTTVDAIKDQYDKVTAKVRDSLSTRAWNIKELRALRRAIGHYSAILGANRANSSRKEADQEVTSVGKVKQAINTNKKAGHLDTTTLGEYFKGKKNMGLFRASENFKADFDSVEDQLTGTFVHEVAHGLLAYALPEFIKESGYWKDRTSELPVPKQIEQPVTDYARTNASEDLCESAMMYFVAPERLRKNCPGRYAFMQKIGTAWVPAPADAPQVQPDAPGKAPEATEPSTTAPPPELQQAQAAIEQVVQKVDNKAPDDTDEPPTDDQQPEAATVSASPPSGAPS